MPTSWLPPDVHIPPPTVGALILAAGASSRLGRPKQLLRTASGETLLHRTVRVAQEGGCASVLVITGALDAELRAAAVDLSPAFIHNENWAAGMGSTIKAGLAELLSGPQPPTAVLILTTDQPAITAAFIQDILRLNQSEKPLAIATTYADTRGIPALFSHNLFPQLAQLPDEQGAKPLLKSLAGQVRELPFPAAALDLDTPEQVAAWEGGFEVR